MSEKVRPRHLARKAVLYVRQSSAHQVARNEESRRLQYAMERRLREMGWREVEVVDEDLGRSASGASERSGFERMVSEVCLGNVGAVAAREASRFARNSRDWQRLVEMCRVVDALLIDHEAVYSPRSGSDRLLLGVKGALGEYELELLRQRSVEARLSKARRGELLVAAPAGYVKTEDGRLEKDPDRRVREAVALVFAKFRELGSARQTLLWFLEHSLDLPVRERGGKGIAWRRPSYAVVHRMLSHPNYGGAYVYGRTESAWDCGGERPRRGVRHRPRERWHSLIPNAHEGYVSWERFERIQETLAANDQRGGGAGAPKRGAALLAGLLRCRRCGRKLMVRYTGPRHDALRYCCHRGWMDNGEPRCIAFGGAPLDEAIAREVLRAVQPGALEAAAEAARNAESRRDEAADALRRDLEAARYEADRAARQHEAVDPANRLVADELETRWNRALERVAEIEGRVAECDRERDGEVPSFDGFDALAADLETVWRHPGASPQLKKRIVRCLVREVVVDVDADAGEIAVVVHWQGGVHTELRLPRRRRGRSTANPKEAVAAVRALVRVCPDDVIAGVLNRNDLRTGRGNRWTRERVASLRNWAGIPRHDPQARRTGGWMNLTEAAAELGVSPRTLRLAAERGDVAAEHPLPDGPWVFNRVALRDDDAVALAARAHLRSGPPAIPNDLQKTLDISIT